MGIVWEDEEEEVTFAPKTVLAGPSKGQCKICRRELGTSDPLSLDCGGDCFGCVQEAEGKQPIVINPEDDAAPPEPKPGDLKQLGVIAKKILHEADRVAFYEAKLKEAKAELERLETTELVEAMDACGLKEFKTPEGAGVTIKDVVAASIKKDNRPAAIAWLKEHGYDGIVKHDFKVELPKDVVKDVKKALALKEKMEKLGVTVTDEETVHPQTLGAWAREMLAEGAEFPLDLLGVYVGRRATVKVKPA